MVEVKPFKVREIVEVKSNPLCFDNIEEYADYIIKIMYNSNEEEIFKAIVNSNLDLISCSSFIEEFYSKCYIVNLFLTKQIRENFIVYANSRILNVKSLNKLIDNYRKMNIYKSIEKKRKILYNLCIGLINTSEEIEEMKEIIDNFSCNGPILLVSDTLDLREVLKIQDFRYIYIVQNSDINFVLNNLKNINVKKRMFNVEVMEVETGARTLQIQAPDFKYKRKLQITYTYILALLCKSGNNEIVFNIDEFLKFTGVELNKSKNSNISRYRKDVKQCLKDLNNMELTYNDINNKSVKTKIFESMSNNKNTYKIKLGTWSNETQTRWITDKDNKKQAKKEPNLHYNSIPLIFFRNPDSNNKIYTFTTQLFYYLYELLRINLKTSDVCSIKIKTLIDNFNLDYYHNGKIDNLSKIKTSIESALEHIGASSNFKWEYQNKDLEKNHNEYVLTNNQADIFENASIVFTDVEYLIDATIINKYDKKKFKYNKKSKKKSNKKTGF